MALVRGSAIVQDALNSTSAVLCHCAGSMRSMALVRRSAIVQAALNRPVQCSAIVQEACVQWRWCGALP